MAVISESNSSRFSFSFLTNDSMARLANPSLSPPWRWHINEWTMLRQASADVGAFEGGGGGICTISRTNKRIYNRSGKINPNVRGLYLNQELTVLWSYTGIHVTWWHSHTGTSILYHPSTTSRQTHHAGVVLGSKTSPTGIHFAGVCKIAAVTISEIRWWPQNDNLVIPQRLKSLLVMFVSFALSW